MNQIPTLSKSAEIVKNISWVKNNPLPLNDQRQIFNSQTF